MEDAPTPFPISDLKEKIINVMEFQLNYEKKNYVLKVKQGKDYLYLEIIEEENITSFYEVSFNISMLIELDKIFKTCDNMDECYDLMISNIKGEKTLIKSKDVNKLILSINIHQAKGSLIEKEITLFKKYQDKKIVIEKLEKEVKELKLIQNNMAKEISELKEKINYFSDQSIIKSSIITDLKKFEFIKERLIKVNIKGKQNHKIFFELLYKAKRHGDKAKDFHKRCDSYNNTLTIIKTVEGLIFGGFTTKTWEGNDFDKEDENAFCFSLDKQKIYNSIKGKKAIYASPNEGPCFQNCIFEVKDDFFENGGTCDADVKSHFDNIKTDYEINGGNNNFLVEELEVFAIYFE